MIVCELCGAVLGDDVLHREWHEAMASAWMTVRDTVYELTGEVAMLTDEVF